MRVPADVERDELDGVLAARKRKLEAPASRRQPTRHDGDLLAARLQAAESLHADRGLALELDTVLLRGEVVPGMCQDAEVRVDGAAARLESSPMLGQHTEEVVSEWLGLNDAAVAELKSEGVFGEPPAAAAE